MSVLCKQDVTTDLDQYVHSDDGHFSYVEWASYNYPGATMYIFNMTSQMYQTGSLIIAYP